MQALDSVIIAPLEGASRMLGLNSSGSRALAAAGITAGVLWFLKPELMFIPASKEARAWGPYAPEDPEATTLTWYLASAAIGAGVYVLV